MNMPLHRRVLILVLIPSLMISFFFVFWFGKQQLQSERLAFETQLTLSVDRLKNSLEFGLMTENIPLIEAISKVALNEPNVRSITILQQNGDRILTLGPTPDIDITTTHHNNTQRIETEHSLMIVSAATHDNAVYYPLTDTIRSDMHWLVLELSKDRLLVKQYQTILIDLVLIIIATMTSIAVSLGITRLIIAPVNALSDGLNELISGNTAARIKPTGVTEMQAISNSVNKLADALDNAYTDLQTGIDQATHDIRETLETLEIQNIELDMARREAIDSSRIKSEFLANMSHEIRTPLNGIIGFANLLVKTHLSRKQDDYAKTIQMSSQSLLTIINDVLDFAKIEAGKLSLDNTPLNLKAAIEDVLVMIAPEAHRKHIELIPQYYQDVPKHIIGDPLRIKQIVTNLVGNAIKFTDEGQVAVRITLDSDFGSSAIIRIAITDTGIGLTQDQKKALFKAFQQANTSTAREYGGTGLGLIISKKLVEQMGGDMGIDSELGRGSTFWFTLRADIVEEVSSPVAIPSTPKSVLLFDLNDTMQHSLVRAITAMDMRVIEATSVQQWIALIKEKTPDFAILGFNTTADVGDDLHNGLAAIRNSGNTHTVVLTNGFEDSITMKLIEQHADVCLSKPFRSDRLASLLNQTGTDSDEDPLKKVYQRGGRILAVDDNDANLRLISTLIEDHGIDVVAVNSGQKALDRLADEHFDLIFMDIQMPHMDGIETTLHIRQLKSQARLNTPIVAVTAHALDSEREHLLRNGFDDYLTKPLSDLILVNTISQWTKLRLEETQLNQQLPGTTLAIDPDAETDSDTLHKPVDISLALMRANQKHDLAIDMFESLIRQIQHDQPLMKGCFEHNDTKGLLELVHRLHGAAHYCGVPLLKRETEVMEMLLKSGEYADIEVKLTALYEAMDAVVTWHSEQDFAAEILLHSDEQA